MYSDGCFYFACGLLYVPRCMCPKRILVQEFHFGWKMRYSQQLCMKTRGLELSFPCGAESELAHTVLSHVTHLRCGVQFAVIQYTSLHPQHSSLLDFIRHPVIPLLWPQMCVKSKCVNIFMQRKTTNS